MIVRYFLNTIPHIKQRFYEAISVPAFLSFSSRLHGAASDAQCFGGFVVALRQKAEE
jgi:hypothetical protein